MKVLVTGFTAFGRFGVNPAEAIGRGIADRIQQETHLDDIDFIPLPVSYVAVDQLISRLKNAPPEIWLMVGVAGTASRIRVERVARNVYGSQADIENTIRGPHPIDPTLPTTIRGSLFHDQMHLPAEAEFSENAGDYLCNYVYWMGSAYLPSKSGFLHIVPADVMNIEQQIEVGTALFKEAIRPRH